jgi:hypothetical protein
MVFRNNMPSKIAIMIGLTGLFSSPINSIPIRSARYPPANAKISANTTPGSAFVISNPCYQTADEG